MESGTSEEVPPGVLPKQEDSRPRCVLAEREAKARGSRSL